MHFTAITQIILAISSMAMALPTATDESSDHVALLNKRGGFDVNKACRQWRPRKKEWAVISTTSHSVIIEGKEVSSEISGNKAIIVNHACKVLAVEPYEAQGLLKGFKASFKGVKGAKKSYDIVSTVKNMGPHSITNAKIKQDGKDVKKVECKGVSSFRDGLSVHYWNSCSWA